MNWPGEQNEFWRTSKFEPFGSFCYCLTSALRLFPKTVRDSNTIDVYPQFTVERRAVAGRLGLHHLAEGGLKSFHFLFRTDRDSNVSRPSRPSAADENVARGHGFDDFFRRALCVQHKAVRSGRRVLITVAVKEGERFGAHVRVDSLPRRNQRRITEACDGSSNSSNGQAIPSTEA